MRIMNRDIYLQDNNFNKITTRGKDVYIYYFFLFLFLLYLFLHDESIKSDFLKSRFLLKCL